MPKFQISNIFAHFNNAVYFFALIISVSCQHERQVDSPQARNTVLQRPGSSADEVTTHPISSQTGDLALEKRSVLIDRLPSKPDPTVLLMLDAQQKYLKDEGPLHRGNAFLGLAQFIQVFKDNGYLMSETEVLVLLGPPDYEATGPDWCEYGYLTPGANRPGFCYVVILDQDGRVKTWLGKTYSEQQIKVLNSNQRPSQLHKFNGWNSE